MNTKERILKELNEIELQLIELSEGYLGEFEDEDPEASAKSGIDGLLDSVRSTIGWIEEVYS